VPEGDRPLARLLALDREAPPGERSVHGANTAQFVWILNEIEILATPEAVFDELSDQRDEMGWSPTMASVELLSGEPITVGSRLRCRWTGTSDNEAVDTDYARPHRWAMQFTSRLLRAVSPSAATVVTRDRHGAMLMLIAKGRSSWNSGPSPSWRSSR
jgi:hypothetical protein